MNQLRLDKLRQQKSELEKRIQTLAARENAAARKRDDRRKIILGGWVMKHRPDLVREIIANGLERDQDKAIFAKWSLDAPKITVTEIQLQNSNNRTTERRAAT